MSFKVGFRQGLCPDPVRSSWSGDGPRPLRWSVWYPAHPAVETVAAEMPPGARYYLLGELALDAAPAAVVERLPVVLLSHGTGGTAASLGWLARRLAAAAWAVLGVDHHGNAASEPHCAAGFICWWERSRDLSLALDMLATAGPFAGRLDQDRVVAAGFSLGAHTALALAGAITDMRLFAAWIDGRPGACGPREFPDLADRLPELLATDAVCRSRSPLARRIGKPRRRTARAGSPINYPIAASRSSAPRSATVPCSPQGRRPDARQCRSFGPTRPGSTGHRCTSGWHASRWRRSLSRSWERRARPAAPCARSRD